MFLGEKKKNGKKNTKKILAATSDSSEGFFPSDLRSCPSKNG